MILPDPAFRISKKAVWYWIVRNLAVVVVAVLVVVAVCTLASFSSGARTAVVIVTAVDLWRLAGSSEAVEAT